MAPGIISDDPAQNEGVAIRAKGQKSYPEPLQLTGALDGFKFEETTPAIGREYTSVNIVDDILNAENAEDRLRDLAITSTSTQPNDRT